MTTVQTAIETRPFQVEIPEEKLAELRRPHRGSALANQRAGHRSVAGRAACDDAGTRPLLE